MVAPTGMTVSTMVGSTPAFFTQSIVTGIVTADEAVPGLYYVKCCAVIPGGSVVTCWGEG